VQIAAEDARRHHEAKEVGKMQEAEDHRIAEEAKKVRAEFIQRHEDLRRKKELAKQVYEPDMSPTMTEIKAY
jgi:hypothetical protein